MLVSFTALVLDTCATCESDIHSMRYPAMKLFSHIGDTLTFSLTPITLTCVLMPLPPSPFHTSEL